MGLSRWLFAPPRSPNQRMGTQPLPVPPTPSGSPLLCPAHLTYLPPLLRCPSTSSLDLLPVCVAVAAILVSPFLPGPLPTYLPTAARGTKIPIRSHFSIAHKLECRPRLQCENPRFEARPPGHRVTCPLRALPKPPRSRGPCSSAPSSLPVRLQPFAQCPSFLLCSCFLHGLSVQSWPLPPSNSPLEPCNLAPLLQFLLHKRLTCLSL